MNKKMGEVFKSIRQARGISLKEATGGQVSISMLSRFENGHTALSAEKLMSCLQHIYLTVSEFYYLVNDFEWNEFTQLIKTIEQHTQPFNRYQLEKLIEQEKCAAKRDGREQYHQLNQIMLQSVIKNHDETYLIKPDDITYLINYLFSVDIWVEYELVLFMYTVSLFPPTTIVLYCQDMLKRIEVFKGDFKHDNLAQTILLNSLFHLLEINDLHHSLLLIKIFDNHFSNTRDAFMKIIFRLAKGYYEHQKGNPNGKEMYAEALHLLDILGYDQVVNYYQAVAQTIFS